MKIILIGSPDSGKFELAEEIEVKTYLDIFGHPSNVMRGLYLDGAVGELSDYRTEMMLASYRASVASKDGIFSHTVLDSFAHTAVRTETKGENVTEEWIYSLLVIGCMIQDSFSYDIAIRMPLSSQDYFAQEVDKILDALVNELTIKTYTPEEAIKEIDRRYNI